MTLLSRVEALTGPVKPRKAKPRRYKGGMLSLTAFEAAWLRLLIDTAPDEAVDTLSHVEIPIPRRVKRNPYQAWERIVEKVAAIAPAGPLDTAVLRAKEGT
jgi:predicted metalloenzyme YecM